MNISALLAGLFSGIIASMGMGGGTVLLIYLAVFAGVEQLAAQGINLIFFIPIGLLSVIIYTVKKKIKFKKTLPMTAAGIFGSFLGLFITRILPRVWLCRFSAIFLITLGVMEIFSKDKKASCKTDK